MKSLIPTSKKEIIFHFLIWNRSKEIMHKHFLTAQASRLAYILYYVTNFTIQHFVITFTWYYLIIVRWHTLSKDNDKPCSISSWFKAELGLGKLKESIYVSGRLEIMSSCPLPDCYTNHLRPAYWYATWDGYWECNNVFMFPTGLKSWFSTHYPIVIPIISGQPASMKLEMGIGNAIMYLCFRPAFCCET